MVQTIELDFYTIDNLRFSLLIKRKVLKTVFTTYYN